MGERTSYPPGTFCWGDLQTTDQEGAKRFYGGLFGWELEDLPVGEGISYTMARLGGRSVAAIAPPPQEGLGAGVPPHWNSYVAVEDADAAVARARELGAAVIAEPFDVMQAGRMAALADPQGGVFLLWQARENIGAGLVNAPGAPTWNELATPEPEAACEFYGELFGWQAESMEGAMGQPYWVIRNGGRLNGGIMAQPPPLAGAPPVWTVYFGAESAERSAADAERLGGRILMPAMSIGMGRIAVLADPAGAVFALFEGEFED